MAEVIFSNIGGTATGKCIASTVLSSSFSSMSCKTGKSIIFFGLRLVSALGAGLTFSRAWCWLQIKFLGTRQLSLQNGKPENRRTYAAKEFNSSEG